jgi:hypothetical protein
MMVYRLWSIVILYKVGIVIAASNAANPNINAGTSQRAFTRKS